jgi:hypothetical protein
MSTFQAADGIDSYTKVMMHMEDTGLTDSSSGELAVTLYGTCARSDTEKKFGTYSASGDGDGDGFSVATGAAGDCNFGTGDFTVDFWEYITANGIYCTTFSSHYTVSVPSLLFGYNAGASGERRIYAWNSVDATVVNNVDMGATILDEWVHRAAVRNGTNILTFRNGVVMSTTAVAAENLNSNAADMGTGHGDMVYGFNEGYLDEYRVSKGIARWTTGFTPPTEAYTAESVSAAGNWTSETQTAASTVSKMGVVVLYKNNEGTATLNTDLTAQVSANNGTNYETATLSAAGTFSTGINIAVANAVTISNTGTAPKYKISFANQVESSKETYVYGVALLY